VRHDFFHEFDFILGFLFCPELFGSWGGHMEFGKPHSENREISRRASVESRGSGSQIVAALGMQTASANGGWSEA
jgi:hypothetical protein